MNDEERFVFDLNGYLHLPGVLDTELIYEMNQWLDVQAKTDPAWEGQTGNAHLNNPITWGESFLNLMDHERVLPILGYLLGDRYRLDHDYAIFLKPGHTGLRLHGPNATPFDPCHYYRCDNGRISCGLTVVLWALTDAPPGSGGLGVIPGSHKSNFECPEDIRLFKRETPIVKQVPLNAGDCVIFTEALVHGTLPWKGPGERRSLFYKYSPCMLSWDRRAYFSEVESIIPPEMESKLNQRQRLLLERPSAIDFHPPIELFVESDNGK